VLADGEVLHGVGYRILDGCPLDSERFTALPGDGQQRALSALAGFLDALHAFPLEVARAAGVTETLHSGGYHPGQRNLPAQLAHLLTTAEVARLDAIVAAYERDHPPVAALVHADLKPAHVLCDPAAIAAKTTFFTTLRWMQDLAYDDARRDPTDWTVARLREHLDSLD
jgi:hypothetical protein